MSFRVYLNRKATFRKNLLSLNSLVVRVEFLLQNSINKISQTQELRRCIVLYWLFVCLFFHKDHLGQFLAGTQVHVGATFGGFGRAFLDRLARDGLWGDFPHEKRKKRESIHCCGILVFYLINNKAKGVTYM